MLFLDFIVPGTFDGADIAHHKAQQPEDQHGEYDREKTDGKTAHPGTFGQVWLVHIFSFLLQRLQIQPGPQNHIITSMPFHCTGLEECRIFTGSSYENYSKRHIIEI